MNSQLMAREEKYRYKPEVINRFRNGSSIYESLKKYPLRMHNGKYMDNDVITIDNQIVNKSKYVYRDEHSDRAVIGNINANDFDHLYVDKKIDANLLTDLEGGIGSINIDKEINQQESSMKKVKNWNDLKQTEIAQHIIMEDKRIQANKQSREIHQFEDLATKFVNEMIAKIESMPKKEPILPHKHEACVPDQSVFAYKINQNLKIDSEEQSKNKINRFVNYKSQMLSDWYGLSVN